MSLVTHMRTYQLRIENVLDRCLPRDTMPPARLHEAMRYAMLGGGKRIRPLLVYLAGEALGVPIVRLDAPAAAVECIHAYSLVHDDLPAMDNDDLRRGRPTCHRVFGEAMAILAGDALQAQAFYLLARDSDPGIPADQRLRMLAVLGEASGSAGMAGGQALDLDAVGQDLDLAQMEGVHLAKTGALIRASIALGALCVPGIDSATLQALDNYARAVGLAFQIQDDILDVEGDTATIGKPQGSDIARNKPTYPKLLGMETAKRTAARLCDEASSAVSFLGQPAATLRDLARYIVYRDS